MEFNVSVLSCSELDYGAKLTRCDSTRMVPTRASLLGWHPLWDNNEKFLGGMDREVEDVVALDSDKSSVFDAFRSK